MKSHHFALWSFHWADAADQLIGSSRSCDIITLYPTHRVHSSGNSNLPELYSRPVSVKPRLITDLLIRHVDLPDLQMIRQRSDHTLVKGLRNRRVTGTIDIFALQPSYLYSLVIDFIYEYSDLFRNTIYSMLPDCVVSY